MVGHYLLDRKTEAVGLSLFFKGLCKTWRGHEMGFGDILGSCDPYCGCIAHLEFGR